MMISELKPIRSGIWKAKLRKIAKFDYLSLVEKKQNHYRMKNKSQMLISPSMLLSAVNKLDYDGFGTNANLAVAREHGSEIMRILKEIFDYRITDINQIAGSVNDKKSASAIIDFLIENEIKVWAVEKFITNGYFCGFVDLIVCWNGIPCIFEIKSRNEHIVTEKDKFQVEFYSRILARFPTYILTIDRMDKIQLHPTKLGRNTQSAVKMLLYWLNKLSSKIPRNIEPVKIN